MSDELKANVIRLLTEIAQGNEGWCGDHGVFTPQLASKRINKLLQELCDEVLTEPKQERCEHKNIRGLDWFDGGFVEICKDCGMSRYSTEQDTYLWEYKDFAQELSDEMDIRFKFQLKQEEYKKYEFCNSINCPFSEQETCTRHDDHCQSDRVFKWLKENNYKIMKG